MTFFRKAFGGYNAVDQTVHGIDNNLSRYFSGRQHKISYGNFVVNPFVDYPLIDTFIPSADNHQIFFPAQFDRRFLVKGLARRRNVNYARSILFPFFRRFFAGVFFTQHRFQSRVEGSGHHQHSRASSVRSVVTGFVLIEGKISDIYQFVSDNSLLHRLSHNRSFEKALHDFGK